LENVNTNVKACFFVSGFAGLIGIEKFDTINKTFVDRNFDWETINQNCEKFYIYHSDNDPYVPLSFAETLSQKLHAELTIIKGAGHFNAKPEYKEFPRLLEDILKFVS